MFKRNYVTLNLTMRFDACVIKYDGLQLKILLDMGPCYNLDTLLENFTPNENKKSKNEMDSFLHRSDTAFFHYKHSEAVLYIGYSF